jgi:hypothetical protein
MLQDNTSDSFPSPSMDYMEDEQNGGYAALETPQVPISTINPTRKWYYLGTIIAVVVIIIFAIVILNGSSSASLISDSRISGNAYPDIQPSTKSQFQQERGISATIKKSVITPGDLIMIEGVVSGDNGPVSLSVFTLEDVKAGDFSRPLLADNFTPASDGKYSINFPINSQNILPGSYVIILKLTTGEWTKLQFLFGAKEVNYVPNSSTPLIAGTYQGYYDYDNSNSRTIDFTITVNQTDSLITGTIWESDDWGYGPSTFKGSVTGTNIKFIKTYNRGNYQVTCKGIYYPDKREISGTWINDDGNTGTFAIFLDEAAYWDSWREKYNNIF